MAQTQNQQSPTIDQYYKNSEKVFINLPDVNLISKNEDELPIAWEFNMLGNFSDGKIYKPEFKKHTNKKPIRRQWANTSLAKLDKKMDELLKAHEEFKEDASAEDKLENVRQRYFMQRIQTHVKEALLIAQYLNSYGFAPIFDPMPLKKAEKLCQIIKAGMDKKLKDIPVTQFTKEEVRKKLDPNNLTIPNQPQNANNNAAPKKGGFGGGNPQPETTVTFDKDAKSEIKISLVENTLMNVFGSNFDYIVSLNQSKESFYNDGNKIPIMHFSSLSGASKTVLINDSINHLRNLLQHENFRHALLPDINKSFDRLSQTSNIERLSDYDKSLFMGISALIGGWTDTIKPGHNIKIDDVSLRNVCLLSGGNTYGKRIANIVSTSDQNFNIQQVPLNKIRAELNSELVDEVTLDLTKIIKTFKNFHEQYSKIVSPSADPLKFNIEIAMFLRGLLRVCSAIDWSKLMDQSSRNEELSSFLSCIMGMAQSCPPDKGHEYYENLYGQHWEALIDKREKKNYQYYF
mmetsp:Transcript_5971/g.5267  ORF Transcript_5971/g.5267 Transcript_5971/m.5267 type:complete len:517 (+) Transcript_5971:1801-3351(+)